MHKFSINIWHNILNTHTEKQTDRRFLKIAKWCPSHLKTLHSSKTKIFLSSISIDESNNIIRIIKIINVYLLNYHHLLLLLVMPIRSQKIEKIICLENVEQEQ